VARPLREQFFLATLVLLVPVSAIMTWAAGTTYNEQLVHLRTEAAVLAATIAAHIDRADPDADPAGRELNDFLGSIPIAPGATVRVVDQTGAVVASLRMPASDAVDERAEASAAVSRVPWTVSVGLPTTLAWWRAAPIHNRTIAISGVATLILLAVEAVFVRRWLRSFATLEGHARRVGSGDYSTPAPDPMPSREMEHLRDTFGTMVSRLREAHANIERQVEEERQMRQEVELLQQQVIRQERLAAIGVLLSGIAHELNNPLQAISGFAQLLQRDSNLSADVHGDLALIQKESARASAIIRNLSRFSRQQGSQPQRVHLRDVVASVVELRQRPLQEKGIRLEVVDEAVSPASAVMTELQQVLLNFVINAEHALAMAGTDRPRITIRTTEIAAAVRLECEDNGPGVPVEYEPRLFQPFFTTKPVGEGTGLGLSVSYSIIEAFGGTIGYRRGDEGGAEFYFELPVPAVLEESPRLGAADRRVDS
jgi:C4-dicarboxylate-specific signal transduction histidine kinase